VIGAQTPKLDLFQKYVISSTVSNPTTGGPLDNPVETDYVYGTPRWRYDTSPITPEAQRTWNQYAGVDSLQIRVGDSNTPTSQQVTDYTYYQGMDGDRATTTGGTKSVSVKGTSIPDSRWFAGQVYEQKTLLGVGGTVLSDTVNTPWASPVTSNDGVNTARFVDIQHAVTTEPVSTGGNRTIDTKTTFDSATGLPLTVSTVPSDATPTCTTTTYATPSGGIRGLPQEVQKVGVACANLASAVFPRDLISDTRAYYDNAALGVIGSHGDVTSTTAVDSYPGGVAHWVTMSTLGYDALGRVTSSKDVLNHTTSTAYTPATSGALTSTTVTNTLGWTTTTAYNPEWGAETSVTDQNGHLTTATYDALGRRTQVWLPQHTQSANPTSPSIKYAYTLSQTGANAIATTSLTGGGQNVDYDLYDGLGQHVQSQTLADGSGTIVTSTGYDLAGRADWQDNAYWTTSVSPSTTLFVASNEATIPSQVHTSFDAAGRPTKVVTNGTGVKRFETDTAYLGADRADITPPSGGTASSVFTNSDSQKTKLVQYLGNAVSGSGQATTYAYNASGAMTGMTDPAGNQWSWSYDVLGHQISATDPDTGITSATFDDGGNQLTSTDARGKLLTYTYDALNRKTAQYAGTASGSLLASWTYDTVAKGDLTAASSYTGSTPGSPGAAYTSTVNSYDAADQPTSTTLSIPAAAPAFGGTTYNVLNSYSVNEQLASQTDPAVGGLPSERYKYGFTTDGRVYSLTAPDFSVLSAFTPIRQLASLDRYVPNGVASPLYEGYTSYGYDQATGAVTGIQDTATFAGAGHSIANRAYTRDDAGEITSQTKTTTYPTATTEVSCYAHDGLGELTQVFTPGSGADCSTTPSAAVLGGPAPLWDTYTYDTAAGNRTSATVHATAGGGSDVTANYTYPAAGAVRPHAVSTVTGNTSTGAGSYGYDADGNTTSAPGQTLTYNENGRVASVTTGAGTQQDVYSASGSLLLQVDPVDGAKLFLGDTVLTKDASGAVSGVRTYTQDGASPVERTTTTGVTGSSLVWLYSDVDATVDTQTVATSGVTTSQYRDPFGNGVGASSGVWGDGFGFLNKPASVDTGLTSLGDRFYDPTLGRFVSADPVLATGNPQQVNGYSYAANDPVTNTDPSGDCYEADTGALTHNVNCALGHGVTAASASTVASMYAKVNGTGNTTAWLRSYNRASYLQSLERSAPGSAHGSWDNYGGAYGKPSPQAAAISAGVGLTVVSVGLAFIPIVDGADTVTVPAAAAEFTSAADAAADVGVATGSIATNEDGLDLALVYKEGWTSTQRAAADAKVKALNGSDELMVTQSLRQGSSAASRYRAAGGEIDPGADVDHIIDLQLGGADDVSNMSPLDASVNRSLGAQIGLQLRGVPLGTRIRGVTIGER